MPMRTGHSRCGHFPTQMRQFPDAEAQSGKEQHTKYVFCLEGLRSDGFCGAVPFEAAGDAKVYRHSNP